MEIRFNIILDNIGLILALTLMFIVFGSIIGGILWHSELTNNEIVDLKYQDCKDINIRIATDDFMTPLNVSKAEKYYDRMCIN